MNKSLHSALVKSAPAEVAHCFTARTMVSQLGKCCPRSPSFICLDRWKSEGAKSALYGGCDTTFQPRLTIYSTVFKIEWRLALSCCKRKVVFFPSLTCTTALFHMKTLYFVQLSGTGYQVNFRQFPARRISQFISARKLYYTYISKCFRGANL